jgi:hypothetical protein
MEEWKRIEGFEDYEISNQGNVMSYKNRKVTLMKLAISKQGYIRVPLYLFTKKYRIQVHRLVLKHFGPPQPPNTTPDHLNRIRHDNRIENLRWATPEEQRENMVSAKGEAHGCSKLTEKQVREIKSKLLENHTRKSLASEYGVSKTLISYIRLGKSWSHIK